MQIIERLKSLNPICRMAKEHRQLCCETIQKANELLEKKAGHAKADFSHLIGRDNHVINPR